jgi:AbrB family looped-hinge helix DNA binding protein
MREISVPIDPAGRVVIPKSVRRELAIKGGDRFTITTHGSSVTLTLENEPAGLVRKGKALVFSTSGGETLKHESVASVLEQTHAERLQEGARGLEGQKRRG